MRFTPRTRRTRETPGEHVVLLGDSVFDCDSYTGEGFDVPACLRPLLDGRVTLLARDGATTVSLPWQLEKLPDDATRLVVSIGGNDALMNSDLLRLNHKTRPRWTDGMPFFQAAMILLYDRAGEFRDDYAEAMDKVISAGLPVTVCTIYNPDYPEPKATAVAAALTMFNDVIIRYALSHGLDIIELRDVCTIPADFELDIEPSREGAQKIAEAIAGANALAPAGAAAEVIAQRVTA